MPGSRLGPEMDAGRDAGPIQKMCGAGSVPGPDSGKVCLTSLQTTMDGATGGAAGTPNRGLTLKFYYLKKRF